MFHFIDTGESSTYFSQPYSQLSVAADELYDNEEEEMLISMKKDPDYLVGKDPLGVDLLPASPSHDSSSSSGSGKLDVKRTVRTMDVEGIGRVKIEFEGSDDEFENVVGSPSDNEALVNDITEAKEDPVQNCLSEEFDSSNDVIIVEKKPVIVELSDSNSSNCSDVLSESSVPQAERSISCSAVSSETFVSDKIIDSLRQASDMISKKIGEEVKNGSEPNSIMCEILNDAWSLPWKVVSSFFNKPHITVPSTGRLDTCSKNRHTRGTHKTKIASTTETIMMSERLEENNESLEFALGENNSPDQPSTFSDESLSVQCSKTVSKRTLKKPKRYIEDDDSYYPLHREKRQLNNNKRLHRQRIIGKKPLNVEVEDDTIFDSSSDVSVTDRLIDPEPYRAKFNHNELECQRRKELRHLFRMLMNQVSDDSEPAPNMSKVQIIDGALKMINHYENVNGNLKNDIRKLKIIQKEATTKVKQH